VANERESADVTLRIPAQAEYVALARLALSAVSRLLELDADDVADLKLAVTEAATCLMPEEGEADAAPLSFFFHVGDDGLTMAVEGGAGPDRHDEERELGRAIIRATVDEFAYDDRSMRLVKYARAAAS